MQADLSATLERVRAEPVLAVRNAVGVRDNAGTAALSRGGECA